MQLCHRVKDFLSEYLLHTFSVATSLVTSQLFCLLIMFQKAVLRKLKME